jgi:hypothetical protein
LLALQAASGLVTEVIGRPALYFSRRTAEPSFLFIVRRRSRPAKTKAPAEANLGRGTPMVAAPLFKLLR